MAQGAQCRAKAAWRTGWVGLWLLVAACVVGAQEATPYLDANGWTVERLTAQAAQQRGDLLAARARVAAAQARVTQAQAKPNPTLEAEFGSPRLLGGEAETDFSVTVGQTFETNGRRRKRVVVAELELAQARAETLVLERQLAASIRASYARAVAAARALTAAEKVIAANDELIRITDERVKQGDAAPLEANLLRVETDRLRVQLVKLRGEAESELVTLRALAGLEQGESLRLAPLPERPPRLDASLAELTAQAVRERPDAQTARLAEELGAARVTLAQTAAKPNVEGFVRFSRSKQVIDLPATLGPNLTATGRDNELAAGLRLELPNRRAVNAAVAEAAANQTAATRTREFLEATIKRDVALAYRRYRTAAEALVLYETQILPRSQDNLRSVRAAYQLGEFSAFDVISEQRRALDNQADYNQAWRDYYGALAELEAALGGPVPASAFAPEPISLLPDERLFVLRPATVTIPQK